MAKEDPIQILDRWLTEHRGAMLKVVYAYTSNQSDQEDLLQDIAIALWNSIPQFRAESKESTWVYKVVLYTATTWHRGESRRKHRSKAAEADSVEDSRPRSPDPRQEWLFETIREFPADDRVLLLSTMEGYSHEEIAELAGMTANNVGVRLHRLKKRLAQLATEYFDDV